MVEHQLKWCVAEDGGGVGGLFVVAVEDHFLAQDELGEVGHVGAEPVSHDLELTGPVLVLHVEREQTHGIGREGRGALDGFWRRRAGGRGIQGRDGREDGAGGQEAGCQVHLVFHGRRFPWAAGGLSGRASPLRPC